MVASNRLRALGFAGIGAASLVGTAAAEASGAPLLALPGEPGGPGLAIVAAKALTASLEGHQVIDEAVLLVRDGRIEALGPARALTVPEDYERLDVGEHWLMPGMIDLHCHVAGSPFTNDINDAVFQANPGLRASSAVVPANTRLERAVAAGVTTVLFIPGSATNVGGQGVLLKTALARYEDALVRDPGSLKIAQGDNPTRWGYGMGRLLMNYTLRRTIRRGLAYAERWQAWEDGRGERPERALELDVFRELRAHRTQVSTHTQYYQLVMMTVSMLAVEFGLDVYIDHGSFDSYLNSERAEGAGVAAVLGPREVMWPAPPRFDTDGAVIGSAWGFQRAGHPRIAFNTDAPVVPEEELPLQAAMGVRYGMSNDGMEAVRGVTIVPALTAGIADRVGSLETGKDADLVVVSGDPNDPRTSVRRVLIGGRTVYDADGAEGRRW